MTGERCAAVVSYGSRWSDPEPDEPCENYAQEGSDYCEEHEEES